ncbi:reverse transcriptase domain-containing protein [Novosphingobium aquiterrae]|uniref:RNA-directed DNA polymerase n=1 Tax=Novosphingobium aquiterrae TaxID=624388 RepID=A0ABV6PEA6_9SPHN
MPGLLEISKALGFAPQHIYSVVATRDSQYVEARIAKRAPSVGFRLLNIPKSGLKGIQRQIARVYLAPVPVDEAAFAYVKRRGVVEAARRLCGDKSILKIDLKDFFPSITTERVFGMYRSLGLDAAASNILTELCVLDNHLPQGAPTSPAISNIVLRPLDEMLRNMSNKWELTYTRYCDDIYFSHQKNFNHPDFLILLHKVITDAGFSINDDKTHFYPRGVPRKTLGLLTHNETPSLPGSVRRRMRAQFHRGSRNIGWGQENLIRLRGHLEWYKAVYGKNETYFQYKSVLDTITKIRMHISYQSA